MPTYAGVTFSAEAPGGFAPFWERESLVATRPIPYGSRDDVQYAGQGNYRVTLSAWVETEAGLATLQAAVGIVPRTLTGLYGSDHASVRLLRVANPRRARTGSGYYATLEFDRAP